MNASWQLISEAAYSHTESAIQQRIRSWVKKRELMALELQGGLNHDEALAA
jgi:hypothetical protein